jgi:hypothetical protein
MAHIEKKEEKKVSLSCGNPVLSDTYPCDFKSINSGYKLQSHVRTPHERHWSMWLYTDITIEQCRLSGSMIGTQSLWNLAFPGYYRQK